MRALDRKLIRNLLGMKGQAAAIAAVVACGVATFVMSLSVYRSMRFAQESYYALERFADVFATCSRAPEPVAGRIAAIRNVERMETRIVKPVTLDIAGFAEPVAGVLVSIPDEHEPLLNGTYLRAGRRPAPWRDDEVLAGEGFFNAHKLTIGSTFHALINGRRQKLTVTGVALAPEYAYTFSPGALFPDDLRYGTFWMNRSALAAAFGMERAFNDVSLTLTRGTTERELLDVLAAVDEVLKPYGGLGSIARKDQASNLFLSMEIQQLKANTMVIPSVFLGVAAFLLNVVMTRLVGLQREQIAALKAFGYSNAGVGWHYLKFVMLVGLAGAAAGVWLGVQMGMATTKLYTAFYHFPVLEYQLDADVVIFGVVLCLAGSALGALSAVRAAAKLPPAEAMRPEAPATYHRTFIDRLGIRRWFGQPMRVVLRNIERRPGRAFASSFGMSFGVAIMVLGLFSSDTIDFLMHVQYDVAQREDVEVGFTHAVSDRVKNELASLRGVQRVETARAVPVRFRHAHLHERGAILGLDPGGDLRRIVNDSGAIVTLPPDGLVISRALAKILELHRGDAVRIEVLDGDRQVLTIPVAAVVDEWMGLNAYMARDALHALLGEPRMATSAFIVAESGQRQTLYRELKSYPGVGGVAISDAMMQAFNDTMAQSMLAVMAILVIFAGVIAFGVVYNTARITLAERSRDLATMRVIGMTQNEVSVVLLGEIALLTLVAIPLGWLIGTGSAHGLSVAVETKIFRFPAIIDPQTYVVSALVVAVSALFSGWIVRRRIRELDLVSVLKTRE